ncbi:hypothetical protein AL065_00925 [Pseudomonas amygdali pv. ulmi]|nr:hypothetical protein AL065_00925 [Pseudomonas amygdali pv. ulmi]
MSYDLIYLRYFLHLKALMSLKLHRKKATQGSPSFPQHAPPQRSRVAIKFDGHTTCNPSVFIAFSRHGCLELLPLPPQSGQLLRQR